MAGLGCGLDEPGLEPLCGSGPRGPGLGRQASSVAEDRSGGLELGRARGPSGSSRGPEASLAIHGCLPQECVGQTAELTCAYEDGVVLPQPEPGREGRIVPF